MRLLQVSRQSKMFVWDLLQRSIMPIPETIQTDDVYLGQVSAKIASYSDACTRVVSLRLNCTGSTMHGQA